MLDELSFQNVNLYVLVAIIIIFEIFLNMAIFLVDSNYYDIFYLGYLLIILAYLCHELEYGCDDFLEDIFYIVKYAFYILLGFIILLALLVIGMLIINYFDFNNAYISVFNSISIFNIFDDLLFKLHIPMDWFHINFPDSVITLCDSFVLLIESILLVLIFTGFALFRLNEKLSLLPSILITSLLIFLFPFNNCFLMFILFLVSVLVYRKSNSLFLTGFIIHMLYIWISAFV